MEAYMKKVEAEAAHQAEVEAGVDFGVVAAPPPDFTENVSAWNAVVEEIVVRVPEAWAEALEPENFMAPLYPAAPFVYLWYHARPVLRIALDMATHAMSFAVARRGHFYQDGGGNWRCTDWIEVPDLAEAERQLGILAPHLGEEEATE